MIFWCLFAFITTGFEHSVANMTLLAIGVMEPMGQAITIGGYFYNLLFVTIGNMLGGILFVALPYAITAGKEPVKQYEKRCNMGFKLNNQQMNDFLAHLQKDYLIYAPKRFVGGGAFSDTDCIRYDKIKTVEEIEYKENHNHNKSYRQHNRTYRQLQYTDIREQKSSHSIVY